MKADPRLPPDDPDRRGAAPARWRVEDGGNGHYYEFIPGHISWTEARRAAEARVFQGVRGYLATITSAREKEFLRQALPIRRAWLGAYQDTQAPDYAEPGGWRWVTGEEWKYTYWAPPAPDEFVPGQNYVEIDPAAAAPDRFGWSDHSDRNNDVVGYYVEYPVAHVKPGKE